MLSISESWDLHQLIVFWPLQMITFLNFPICNDFFNFRIIKWKIVCLSIFPAWHFEEMLQLPNFSQFWFFNFTIFNCSTSKLSNSQISQLSPFTCTTHLSNFDFDIKSSATNLPIEIGFHKVLWTPICTTRYLTQSPVISRLNQIASVTETSRRCRVTQFTMLLWRDIWIVETLRFKRPSRRISRWKVCFIRCKVLVAFARKRNETLAYAKFARIETVSPILKQFHFI